MALSLENEEQGSAGVESAARPAAPVCDQNVRASLEDCADFLTDLAVPYRQDAEGLVGSELYQMIQDADDCERWAAEIRSILDAQSRSQRLSGRQGNTSVAHAPRDTPEPSSPREDERSKLSGGWGPIETAPFDPEWSVLGWEPGMDAAVEMVWRQDMRRWLTRGGRDIAPTHWHPLPALPQDHAPVRGREGSVDRQTNGSSDV